MFHTYHQPRMPRAYYAGPRWQYWWFRQPRKKYRNSKKQKVVYSGNPKGATAVCLLFLGIFFVISGIFMAGFGYNDSYRSLQIIGPVFLAFGIIMVCFGSILCMVVKREFQKHQNEDNEEQVVEESPKEEKSKNKAGSRKPPLLLIMNNNGNSTVSTSTYRQISVASSTPSTPQSPGNGVSLNQPMVVVTPPADGGAASPKSPRLPFQPVGPAFPISEKEARAASIERVNEIGHTKKKKVQQDEDKGELGSRSDKKEKISIEISEEKT
ncbi:uncharacterized protein [Ptychodera flava]|uniref:uncharacterized protein n=1 Tax=Ptychodera flava TaxID=63121 RepID=UPI00396A0942